MAVVVLQVEQPVAEVELAAGRHLAAEAAVVAVPEAVDAVVVAANDHWDSALVSEPGAARKRSLHFQFNLFAPYSPESRMRITFS